MAAASSSPRASVVAVTHETLARIHRRTATATFWELDPLSDAYTHALPEADKGAWLVARAFAQGTVGFSIAEARSSVGAFATVLFCPAADAPGAVRMPTAPASHDAWLVTSLHIDTAALRRGWESVLLDAVIMAAAQRGADALEVFGFDPANEPASAMSASIAREASSIGLVEVSILESAGFTVIREHPVVPRLRLELPPTHNMLTAREVADLLAEIPVGG
ncbi:hypothetical protein G7Y29_10630 [Corynebacterium qintianiae]|uniref:GNAT family N-acetyltransferase n=1 Tax=Corynebacterium qintianiae TaxID=2709392 RepID=A0A7T0KMK1_9CORY|nr:hypothetical protein [Corynebacterium qintianiae]QPK83257.1 hypothetical protein G7Y29_10630 [Corynebacterium qintianiae]